MTHAMGQDKEAVVFAENLSKIYRRGAETVRAVDDVSFEIALGEFVAFVGPSGAGKTTLLQMIGGMDGPTSGRLLISGRDISTLSDGEMTRLRRETIGFVFQSFSLLPTLTVLENVLLPARPGGTAAKARAESLLESVGLSHRLRHRPSELSGGEMQRAAIARALINRPRLLLADEPTGNLDTATGVRIIELLQRFHEDGLTLGVVTHNPDLVKAAQRVLSLQDGRISSYFCPKNMPSLKGE